MIRNVLLCLCATAVSNAFRAEVRDPKSVKVSIFYESQCPNSREFINKQLWPHWFDLEEALNLDLIPYGRTNSTLVDDHWEFSCERGPGECLTNKLHACVIKKLHSHKTKMLKVIKCLLNKKDQQIEGLPDCLGEIHIKPDVDKFLECMNSAEGDTLFATHGVRTIKAFKHIDTTPKIVYNDKFKKRDEAESKKDFRKLVCDHYIFDLCQSK